MVRSSILQNGHQWPRLKLITTGPPASKPSRCSSLPDREGSANGGMGSPTFGASVPAPPSISRATSVSYASAKGKLSSRSLAE